MKLLVFGGTGNVGQQLIRQALDRDHHVRAVVRTEGVLSPSENLEIVQASILELSSTETVFSGVDAVISCLGIRKESRFDPWSRLLSPLDFTERSTKIMIEGMKEQAVDRLITISSAGVGDSWDEVEPDLQQVIATSSIQQIFTDLEKMEQVMLNSGLDTLAVRPVALVDGDPTGEVAIVTRFQKTSKVMTGDVAVWMLDAVERSVPFVQKTEMIASFR